MIFLRDSFPAHARKLSRNFFLAAAYYHDGLFIKDDKSSSVLLCYNPMNLCFGVGTRASRYFMPSCIDSTLKHISKYFVNMKKLHTFAMNLSMTLSIINNHTKR